MAVNDKWEIYEDKKGEWRWRRTASNGKIVGSATEGYKNRIDAVRNAEHYGYNGKFNPAGSWELYEDKAGAWRWRHKAVNDNIIGSSSEGYANKTDAVKNAERHGYTA